jgi:hypothetical protein
MVRGKPAGQLARTAVVVLVGHVLESGGLESGAFHVRTLLPAGCGLLLYNSYSSMTAQTLYKSFVFL